MNLKQLVNLFILVSVSLLFLSKSSLAQESNVDKTEQTTQQQSNINKPPRERMANNDGNRKPTTGKPPQSAIDACLNKPVKTQCEFMGPRATETGFCEMTPDEQYFACKPMRKKH